MKRIFLILCMIFSFPLAFSQEQSISNYGGRRVLSDRETKFSLIAVRIQDSEEKTACSKMTLYFNDIIDSSSVMQKNIFLNDRPLSENAKTYFSKKGQSVSFIIKKHDENFSLRVLGIRNLDGQIMHQIRLNNLEENSFWHFSRETLAWQKS